MADPAKHEELREAINRIIGDMFNYELRDRVELLCQELSDPSHGEHEPMLARGFRP